MCWRLVAFGLGTGMHHDLLSPALGKSAGTIQRAVRAVEAEAHLRRHRNLRRYGAAYLAEDGVKQFRLLEQHGAATRLVNRLGRATKVEVDDRRPQCTGERGVIAQANRIGAQQLHTHGRAGAGTRALGQLGGQLLEGAGRQQAIAHPDEFGHAPVDATDTGQHVAEDIVDQPLHGRQGDLHAGVSSRKGA
ncbi:hypothetical protein D3C77_545210 [compost metagenome]